MWGILGKTLLNKKHQIKLKILPFEVGVALPRPPDFDNVLVAGQEIQVLARQGRHYFTAPILRSFSASSRRYFEQSVPIAAQCSSIRCFKSAETRNLNTSVFWGIFSPEIIIISVYMLFLTFRPFTICVTNRAELAVPVFQFFTFVAVPFPDIIFKHFLHFFHPFNFLKVL